MILFASTPDQIVRAPETNPLYLGTTTSGVKTSDVYTEGNFSIVAPVWSTLGADATLSGDVLYLEPYTSWGEGGEVAASLGLGWRHLFGSQPVSALTRKDAGQAGFLEEGVFIGANVFVDMLDTEANNQFWQLGVGVEVGTRYVEVRGNYYIPLSDKQLAEQQRTREVIRNSSTSQSNSTTPLSNPYATGNTVAQDALFTTRATTTTRTTTIDRIFRRYEEGMEGWDAEVAVLVPGLDKYFDLRLIGGYYSFDNQPLGPQVGGTGNVEGFKAGMEIRPVPAVILTGTWYEDDRLTGSDWTAGVQLQLPFEIGDIGDGKGFWGRIGDSFKPRRRHLAERMAEPAHRQNAAIKIANSVDVDTTTSTKVKRVTKVVSQRQGQIILADDVVFVNNGAAVGNGIQEGDSESNGADGTAEKPFETMLAGATLAGNKSNTTNRVWNVYTQGTPANYADNLYLDNGSVNFIGSGEIIQGIGGRNFGKGPAPTLVGGFSAVNIGFLGVTGYVINEGFGLVDGIIAEGVSKVRVVNNIINADRNAISINTGGANVDAIIRGNRMSDLRESAILLYGNHSSQLQVSLVDNYIYDTILYAVYAESTGTSKVDIRAAGNFIGQTWATSIYLDSGDESTLNASFSGNTISQTQAVGIYAFSDGESKMNLIATGNTIQNPQLEAFYVQSFGFSEMAVSLAGNHAWSPHEAALKADAFSYSSLNLTVTNNTFEEGLSNGILLTSRDFGSLSATLNGNILRNLTGDGVQASNDSVADSLNIYGSDSNFISGQSGLRYNNAGSLAPKGGFIINGVWVDPAFDF